MKKSIALGLVVFWVGAMQGSCPDPCDSNVFCKSQFLPRSAGAAGYRQRTVRADSSQQGRSWSFDLALDFSQNFDTEKLGEYFSFRKDCNTFTVGPDGECDTNIRNIELGLAPDFKSNISLNPRIRNFVVEPSFYVDLGSFVRNTWFAMYLPITWTQWDMQCCEQVCQQGASTFSSGFVADEEVRIKICSALDAFAGKSTFGDKKCGLSCCRINCCKEESKWAIADVPMMLGWKFINTEKSFAGFYVMGVAPAGNDPESRHIFEPRAGYNRWQFGGGFHGQKQFWTCPSGKSKLWGYFDVRATHLFSHTTCRCLDLCKNGCGSKYLLLKEFESNMLDYNGRLVNVADIAKIKVKSKFDYEVEAVFGLKCHRGNLTVDAGYNLWARGGEQFDCCKARLCRCSDSFQGKRYGIKGDREVTSSQTNEVMPCASMCNVGDAQAANIDNNVITRDNILDQVSYESAAIPKAMSHTLYLYGSYQWTGCQYPMTAGFGAKVEFGQHNKALNTWGLWTRIGATF